MFSAFKHFAHLGDLSEAELDTPPNAYVAEDNTTFYVAEDGVTYYVQES